MGNSLHYCICVRQNEGGIVKTDWKSDFLENLKTLDCKESLVQELYEFITKWDQNFDKHFRKQSRWQFFLNKECEKTALDYELLSVHRNVFKELEADLQDPRNIFNSLLGVMNHRCSIDYFDQVQDAIASKSTVEILSIFDRMKSDVISLIDFSAKLVLSYYNCLGSLLSNKIKQLNGVLMKQIIARELYMLLISLTRVFHADLTQKVVHAPDQPDIIPDPRAIAHLHQLYISENPYDKALHLHALQSTLPSKLHKQKTDKLIWTCVKTSKVTDIFAHLHLIDAFVLESSESSVKIFLDSLNRHT